MSSRMISPVLIAATFVLGCGCRPQESTPRFCVPADESFDSDPGPTPPRAAAVDAEAVAANPTIQVLFTGPAGARLLDEGDPTAEPLTLPARKNFPVGDARLRLSPIGGNGADEFQVQLEIRPVTPHTNNFLAWNAVPIAFTDDDFARAPADRETIQAVCFAPVTAEGGERSPPIITQRFANESFEANDIREGVCLILVRVSRVANEE